MTLLRRSAFVFFSVTFAAAVASAQTKTLLVRPTPPPPEPTGHAASYYHYGLAKMYESQAVQSGRQDLATQAVEQYKLALNADPDSRILANGLANLYFNLGRVKEAVTAAQGQVKAHPDDVEAHQLLGRTYLRSLGNGEGQQSSEMLQAAIGEYETIAKLKPKDLETHLLLGQLYGLSHDTTKAIDQFKQAQEIDPGSEEVVLSMARLYTEAGDMKGAAKVIADVPAEDRSERENFALAGIYDQLKMPAEATEAYKLVLAQDADNAEAKKGLAQSLLVQGKNEEAAKVYAQILKTDPQDPQALVRQAEIERQAGKYEESLATLKKAEAQVSESIEIEYNEGLVYDALGRFDEAVSMFKRALTASLPPDGKYTDGDKQNRALFLDRLANVYREQGKTNDALDTYKEMAKLGGTYSVRAADATVDTYRDAHNWKAALDAAATAAKASTKDRDLQLTYARQLGDAGKLDEGVKLAKAQLGTAKDPEAKREVYLSIADMYARAKKWKDANDALEQAEQATSSDEEKAFVYYYRGHVADVAKMYDEAEIWFRKGLAITPDSASIQNDYGYMLVERGVRLDEAVAMLKKAVASDPQNGAYLDSLAWAYYKQGQYALAESYERKAVLRMPTDPALRDHMGEIESRSGKLQAAVEEWDRAMKLYGTSLEPEADPADVAKVQKKLETAKVKLAKLNREAK